mgnify:CR=1 FL=1
MSFSSDDLFDGLLTGNPPGVIDYLWHKLGGRACQWLRNARVPDPDAVARDCFQQALIAFFSLLQAYPEKRYAIGQPEAYLRTTLYNLLRAVAACEQRERSPSDLGEAEADIATLPLHRAVWDEMRQAAQQALQQMPETWQVIVELKYYQQMSWEEVAHQTGHAPDRLRKQLAPAFRREQFHRSAAILLGRWRTQAPYCHWLRELWPSTSPELRPWLKAVMQEVPDFDQATRHSLGERHGPQVHARRKNGGLTALEQLFMAMLSYLSR